MGKRVEEAQKWDRIKLLSVQINRLFAGPLRELPQFTRLKEREHAFEAHWVLQIVPGRNHDAFEANVLL